MRREDETCRGWPEAVSIRRPPRRCLRMRWITSWQQRKTSFVLTVITLFHSASVMSSILAVVVTPACATQLGDLEFGWRVLTQSVPRCTSCTYK